MTIMMMPRTTSTDSMRTRLRLDGSLEAEVEILTEVNALDLRVATENIRPSRAEDLAVINNVGAIGDHEGFAHIVVGHEDADSGALQLEDDALQLEHLDGIDAGERLVEQAEFWIDGQRPRNLHAAPLASGEHVAF